MLSPDGLQQTVWPLIMQLFAAKLIQYDVKTK